MDGVHLRNALGQVEDGHVRLGMVGREYAVSTPRASPIRIAILLQPVAGAEEYRKIFI